MMKKIISIILASLIVLTVSSCGKQSDAEVKAEELKNVEVGDVITMGVYEQDNNESNGKEPIEWRVLAKEDGKVLLITDKVIDCIPFNNEMQEWITWEDSSLRAWLANDFIATAFSKDEAARILETSNENDEIRDYGVSAMPNTTDRVFLLSIKETTEYLGTEEYASMADKACVAYPTEYAVAKGIEVRNGGAVMWWLRESTAGTPASACDDLGKRFHNGRPMDYTGTGVRPAMWVEIDTK